MNERRYLRNEAVMQKSRLVPLSSLRAKQVDRERYGSLSSAGVKRYAELYMGEELEGIPAEDLNSIATMIYVLKDNKPRFNNRPDGKPRRHIDIGTGPNLHVAVASAPYVDEIITIDYSPANVNYVRDIASGINVFPSHLTAWGEIAAMLYDIGGASELKTFSQDHTDLYDCIRNWCRLDNQEKDQARNSIYETVSQVVDNPYRTLNIEEELRSKLKPRRGDILEDVNTVRDLVGSADITTMAYVAESISGDPIVAVHGLRNATQLGKDGSLWISTHMLVTTGYKGFFTEEEQERDPRSLEELPATAGFFDSVVGTCMKLSSQYDLLWRDSTLLDHQKMVRSEPYGGVAIYVGEIDSSMNKDDGMKLLLSLRKEVRYVVAEDMHTGELIARRFTAINEAWRTESNWDEEFVSATGSEYVV